MRGQQDDAKAAHGVSATELPHGCGTEGIAPVGYLQRTRKYRLCLLRLRQWCVTIRPQPHLLKIITQEEKCHRHYQEQHEQTQHDPGNAPADEADEIGRQGHQEEPPTELPVVVSAMAVA